MLEEPDNQGQGPSRGDPAPPPPSPVVHHNIRPESEEIEKMTSSHPPMPPPPAIIKPKETRNATLDLLQATSESLSKEINEEVSLSSTQHESVTQSSEVPTGDVEETDDGQVADEPSLDQTVPKISPHPTVEDETRPGQYRLKWIKFKGNKLPIITQNENGPCPLIAIMNVLLLKGRLRLPSVMDVISADQLMEYLGDCILASLPKNLSEGQQLNFEQNMMDAIAILPKLQTGLDVNVRFTSISDFEFTPELIVFDLLHIPLHHGWLVDPFNCPEMAKAIGSCSYNQLVDKIINNKSSPKSELVTEALLAEEFLETTASQLTYYGLEELIHHVKPDDPCVLFRNNHFITLYKHNNQLYQLVTDQGFLAEENVIWETLNNIEGDGRFVDDEYKAVPPKPQPLPLTLEQMKLQEDQDYLLALSLQEEYKKEAEQRLEWEETKLESGLEGLSDEEIAKRLQMQENAKCQQQQQHHQQQQTHVSRQQQQPSSVMIANRPSSSHSSYRRIPQQFESSTQSSKSTSTYYEEASQSSMKSYGKHQQSSQYDRPSSASSRIPPRKSASMIEPSDRSHQSGQQHHSQHQQQHQHGHSQSQHPKRSSERHHLESESRGSSRKSNCSVM